MTEHESDDRFAVYLDDFVSYLEGTAKRPIIDHLGPEDREELSAMFRIIEANWASEIEMPPFEEDPVALALGLVESARSGTSVVVSGSRVRALRQAMKLSRSDLVAAISSQGWMITSSEVSLLERAELDMLPVSQVAALARALQTRPEALAPGHGDPVGAFLRWLYSDEFDQVVASWSVEHGRAIATVADEIRSKMLAPARRGRGPAGRAQWLQTLRAVLEAME